MRKPDERASRARSKASPSEEVRPRILLVDDEDLMLRALIRQLSREGIEARAARHAREAAEILARTNGDFDAIVCDLHMPNGNGIDLCRFVESEYPDLKNRIIIVTGAALSQRDREFLRTTTNPVMYKPFDIEPLVHLARDWASRRRSRGSIAGRKEVDVLKSRHTT